MTELPVIDYDAHPAFMPFAGQPRMSDAAINTLVSEIEDAYAGVDAMLGDSDARKTAFDREVAPRIARLTALLKDAQIHPDFAPHFLAAVESARDWLRHDLAFPRPAARNSDVASLDEGISAHLSAMRRDGFARFSPQTDLARTTFAATKLERAVLRHRARKSPKRHCGISLHPNSRAYRTLKQAVASGGVRDLASAYMGQEMELIYASLEHAHAGQQWYKGCYDDMKLPTSETVYMHLDADNGVLKAMMYLKDVTADDGPFAYVRGSHQWRRPLFTLAVRKGLDHQQGEMFALEDDGLDYKSGYYRPLYSDPRHRADIMSLPAALRGSTHFGDDVQDGSDLSRSLLEGEEAFTGPAGTLVMFDGSRGIHRGSLVKSGSRWVIQFGFRVKDGAAQAVEKRDLAGALRGKLRYARHALRYLRELAG